MIMGLETYTCSAWVDSSWIKTNYSLQLRHMFFRIGGNSCVVEKQPMTCLWSGNFTLLISSLNLKLISVVFSVQSRHSLADNLQSFGFSFYKMVIPKSPEQLFVVVREVHYIKVQWFRSKTSDVLKTMELQYKIMVEAIDKTFGYSLLVGTEVFQYTIENLHPYNSYNVSVSCRSIHTNKEDMWSPGTSIITRTLTAVPGQMDSPTLTLVERNMLNVSWKPPNEPNGPLNAYQLRWGIKDRQANIRDVIDNLNILVFLSCHLSVCEVVYYEFQIRACNIRNGVYLFGTFSPPIHLETCFNISDLRKVNFMLLDVMFTTVTVGWELLCPNQISFIDRIQIQYCQSNTFTECKVAMREPDESNYTLSSLKPATTYNISIVLFNLNNKTGEENEILVVTTLNEGSSMTVIVLGVVALLVIITFLFWIYRHIKLCIRMQERSSLKSYLFHRDNTTTLNSYMEVENQDEIMPYIQKMEFTKDRLKMGDVLGEGAFGRVVRAKAIGLLPGEASTTVAVKMFKDGENKEQRKALISELKILAYVGRHVNIVNMLGVVTKNIMKGELMVILEYCALGNLQQFLQKHRKSLLEQWQQRISSNSPQSAERTCVENVPVGDNAYVTLEDQLCIIFQCARGMEYLSSRKLIHRDLAARNLLLTQDKIIKICDFGLTKDCYKDLISCEKSNELLPIKWLAIESFKDCVFSTKSDVWSFGVLLWEIYSLGSNPYPGIMANRELFNLLEEGYRMEKPDLAPDDIYQIMLKCWLVDPDERPGFGDLVIDIGNLLQATVKQFYLDLNKPYEEMNWELSRYGYLEMDLFTRSGYTTMLSPTSSKEGTQSSVESEIQTTHV